MKKTEQFFEIDYNECDNEYINLLVKSLIDSQKRIMDFFKLKELDKKIKIQIWSNLDKYREYVNEKLKPYNKKVQDWECGRATNNKNESVIDMVTYNERLKCESHQNDTITNMINTIIHEFVHICHFQYINYKKSFSWYNEALATILSNQYNNALPSINCSLEDIMKCNTSYRNYYSLGRYVFDVYGNEYVLKLAKDYDLLVRETPRLYEEAKEWINSIEK